MEPKTYEFIYDAGPTAHLVVENIRGAVAIQAKDGDQIAVTAVLHPESGSEADTQVEISQQPDGTVKAITRFGQDGIGYLAGRKPCKVDYTILAPPRCDIEVRCVSSNLVVEGVQGKIELDTVSGGMGLREISGDLSFKTVSGGISGAGLKGALTVKTVSGDVKLGQSEFRSLKLSTVSGDFSLEGPLGDGPYHFNSVSGDVRLIVPPDTGCEIVMNSFSGDLRMGLSATYHKRGPRARQVTVQDGGTEIYMHSMSGDLLVMSPEGEMERGAPPPPTASAEQAGPADTLSILDRIASGELSVEEGIRIIEEG